MHLPCTEVNVIDIVAASEREGLAVSTVALNLRQVGLERKRLHRCGKPMVSLRKYDLCPWMIDFSHLYRRWSEGSHGKWRFICQGFKHEHVCRFNHWKCRFKHHKRPFNHQIWLGKTSSKLNFNLEFLSSKSACFIMGSWHNTSTKGGTKIGDQQSQPWGPARVLRRREDAKPSCVATGPWTCSFLSGLEAATLFESFQDFYTP